MTDPWLVDYHNHTILCNHATGTIPEYVERAARLGIQELGFSEHSYWMRATHPMRLAPTKQQMGTYFEWMGALRRGPHEPVIRVGIEADWVPEKLDEAQSCFESHPLDYVYGSVHHIPNPSGDGWVSSWGFENGQAEAACALYFESLRQMIRAGFCDIIAHLDVIRRHPSVPLVLIVQHAEELLEDLADSGVAVEINTSGMDYSAAEFYPCRPVLQRLVAAGVPITFGSDAHSPEQVGRYLNEARQLLVECGGKEFYRFEGRRKISVPLSS